MSISLEELVEHKSFHTVYKTIDKDDVLTSMALTIGSKAGPLGHAYLKNLHEGRGGIFSGDDEFQGLSISLVEHADRIFYGYRNDKFFYEALTKLGTYPSMHSNARHLCGILKIFQFKVTAPSALTYDSELKKAQDEENGGRQTFAFDISFAKKQPIVAKVHRVITDRVRSLFRDIVPPETFQLF